MVQSEQFDQRSLNGKKVKRNTFCCNKEKKKDRYLGMYIKKELNTTFEFSQEQRGTVFLCVKKRKTGKNKRANK